MWKKWEYTLGIFYSSFLFNPELEAKFWIFMNPGHFFKRRGYNVTKILESFRRKVIFYIIFYLRMNVTDKVTLPEEENFTFKKVKLCS